MNGKWVRWSAIAVAALPALVPLWTILVYGVDVPYWDQWEGSLGGLYIKAADGNLSFWDFTSAHNEHRVFVPRVLAYLLNRLTMWNTIGEMLLQWVLVCITAANILWLARRTVGGGKLDGKVLFLWFLSNLMVFTPQQHENWLWGMGLVNVMPPLFFTGAMVVVLSGLGLWWRVGLSMLMCAGAMFSLGSGVATFPLVGALWAWSESWEQLKAKRWVLLAWVGGFAICLVMYLYNFKLQPPAPGLENVTVTLRDRLVYQAVLLGTQFQAVSGMERATASAISGLTLLGLSVLALGYFVFLWVSRRAMAVAGAMLPWCLILVFVLFSAFMAMIFRTLVGLENAMSSRYVTFMLYAPVGLIFLVPLICRDLLGRLPILVLGKVRVPLQGLWTQTPTILATVLIMAHLVTLPLAMRSSELMLYGRLEAKAALLLINVLPHNPKLSRSVYPTIPLLRETANRLDQLGYIQPRLINTMDVNQIRDPRFNDPQDAREFGVFERMTESGPGVVTASGWALWPDTLRPADAVILTYETPLKEQIIFAASEGIYPRGDLSQRYGNSNYELAGWVINFSVAGFPPEISALRISAWALDARTGKARPLWGQMNLVQARQTQP